MQVLRSVARHHSHSLYTDLESDTDTMFRSFGRGVGGERGGSWCGDDCGCGRGLLLEFFDVLGLAGQELLVVLCCNLCVE